MTIDEQITALIAKAEPLRCLPDEEAESMGLPGIVEQINALRAEQSRMAERGIVETPVEPVAAYNAAAEQRTEAMNKLADAADLPKRKPGRPRKVEARIEGEDA